MKDDLLNAIKSSAAPDPSSNDRDDALEQVKQMARAMRDLSLSIKDQEERLAEQKKALFDITSKKLPELFNEHKVRSLTLEPEGNLPAYEVSVGPYYKAVLPVESDPGLRWLEDNGHGDLIKRSYNVELDRDSEVEAKMLREFLEQHDLPFEEKESVHWATLTSFVKEQIEKSNKSADIPAPPLDLLGAFVGQVAKMKLVRE